MSDIIDIELEVETNCALGEGPLWVPHTRVLWWVDIMQADLHALDTISGRHTVRRLPVALTSLGLRAEGGFVGTLWDRFVLLDEDMELIQQMPVQEPDQPENRFNDGKVDPFGRFWAGTMHADLGAPTGSLYALNAGRVSCRDSGYTVTNGPTFSPDGRTLYHTSTTERLVFAFDLNDDGSIANKRVFAELPEAEGLPDGMTVDETGAVWVCHYSGGRVTRFDATGRRIAQLKMPVSCITSCTFGGAELDRLYFTTAAQSVSLEDEPKAGSLFSIEAGVKGLKPNYYRT